MTKVQKPSCELYFIKYLRTIPLGNWQMTVGMARGATCCSPNPNHALMCSNTILYIKLTGTT